jgi:hypothetical protein
LKIDRPALVLGAATTRIRPELVWRARGQVGGASMASELDVYATLYVDCVRRAVRAVVAHPWTLAVPPVILATGVVVSHLLETFHDVGPLVVALVSSVLWAGYFYVLRRLAVGVRADWDDTKNALVARASDFGGLAEAAILGAVVFLSLEYGGCLGSMFLVVTTVSPGIELLALRDAEPQTIVNEGWRFITQRPLSWAVPMFFALMGLSILWLMVGGIFGITLSLIDDELTWLSGLAAAVILGPVLHLFFVARARLFLELEHTTHAQRMYRARQAAP